MNMDEHVKRLVTMNRPRMFFAKKAAHQSIFNDIILVTAWMTTLAAIWISYGYWRSKRKESK